MSDARHCVGPFQNLFQLFKPIARTIGGERMSRSSHDSCSRGGSCCTRCRSAGRLRVPQKGEMVAAAPAPGGSIVVNVHSSHIRGTRVRVAGLTMERGRTVRRIPFTPESRSGVVPQPRPPALPSSMIPSRPSRRGLHRYRNGGACSRRCALRRVQRLTSVNGERCGRLVTVVFGGHPQLTRTELPHGTFRTEGQDLRWLVLVVSQEAAPTARSFVTDRVALDAGQAVGHTTQFSGLAVGLNWLFCERSTSLSGS